MESIQNYAARQMAKYDRNRDGIINLTQINTPFFQVNAEAAGRAKDFFQRSAVLGAVCDQYSLYQGVAREIDTNRDGHVSFFEGIKGWFKTGLW